MGQTDYLRFLVAMHSDPDLRADLRRTSASVRTLDDLADFARRHGYHFGAADIPLRRGAPPPDAR